MPPRELPGCNSDTSGLTCENGPDDFTGKMAQGFIVRGPREGHDAAVIGWDRRLIEAYITKVMAELTMAIDGFILLQETNAVLSNEDSSGLRQRLQPS